MIAAPHPPNSHRTPSTEKAITLALTLAQAENAIREFSGDQVDAIVDADGLPYLLRSAQQRLRENEARLQTLLDSTADGITVVNRGGVIISQNRSATHGLGYEQDGLVGMSIFDFVQTEDLPQVYSTFFNVIEGFCPETVVKFRHLTSDGSYRLLEASVSRLRDASMVAVVLTCRDMTRSQRPPEAAAGSASFPAATTPGRSRFLAMLAHELRNPLTPVLFGIQDLKDDERFAEARPTLLMMERNVELESRLIAELNEFTAIGQHKVHLRCERIDAHQALHHALEVCQGESMVANVMVELDLRASESWVLADSMKLQQILWNLIKNAVKFSPAGSSIAISSINERPGEWVLEIRDQGIGIEPELLPFVFDPFQQGLHPIQQRYGGLGLGLFIAKSLVEAQQGTLTAFSKGSGKGSCFRLTLATVPATLEG